MVVSAVKFEFDGLGGLQSQSCNSGKRGPERRKSAQRCQYSKLDGLGGQRFKVVISTETRSDL